MRVGCACETRFPPRRKVDAGIDQARVLWFVTPSGERALLCWDGADGWVGNWLRDYSQALDIGPLAKVHKDTIRVIVWVLSFMSFGFATGEFEVTEERLGVYRPEEHIGLYSLAPDV